MACLRRCTPSRVATVLAPLGSCRERKIKDADKNYLWQLGLVAGQPDRLLGFPVLEAEDMPNMVAGSLSNAFGNWKEAYQIVDRLGMTILRDPYSKKPFVEFNARRRVGGDVVNPEALVLLRAA
jgi:HK97 family phage major capsid protein